jgi:hypothetical protein
MRIEHGHRELRLLVLGVLGTANERDRDVRRNLVRVHVQQRVSQLLRRVRQQRQYRQLRNVLHGVLDAGELHGHVRWRELRIHVQ